MVELDQQALDNCDKEPIHIPGTVQSFGCLLASDLYLDRFEFCSANSAEFLGQSAPELLERPPLDLFGKERLHDLRNLLGLSTSARQRALFAPLEGGVVPLDVYAHINSDGRALLELEPSRGQSSVSVETLRALLASVAAREDLNESLQVAVEGLQQLSGFRRVQALRYEDNGDGEIVAEAIGRPEIPSFLGLRFPAWDVPRQARRMQVLNPVRVIEDVAREPVPLVARQESDPLDLSLAHLRGVSPVHLKYMANMGVRGSMSLSLIVGGKAWGVLTCHHPAPYVVPALARTSCEVFAQMVSLLLEQKLSVRQVQRVANSERVRRQIALLAQDRDGVLEDPERLARLAQSALPCDGVAVVVGSEVLHREGSAPSPGVCLRLARLDLASREAVTAIDSLHDGELPRSELEATAGALIVGARLDSEDFGAAPSRPQLVLLFFRDEIERTIRWAGRPTKDIEQTQQGPQLSPRASFESFLEQRRGLCEPWTEDDLRSAAELESVVGRLAERAAAKEEKTRNLLRHQRRQELLIAELNHRVRNILALVRSVSERARASANNVEQYAETLESRIAAISQAHDLAIEQQGGGVPIREILETVLRPALLTDRSQVFLEGPALAMRADTVPILALVFHELAANAMKYGSLADPEGLLRVRWDSVAGGVELQWREFAGPKVGAPERQGFGGTLIRQAIPHELGGRVEYELAEAGVRFVARLDADCLDEAGTSSARPSSYGASAAKLPAVVADRDGSAEADRVERALGRVLIVEDNLILALELSDKLTALGAESVETAGGVRDAMAILEDTELAAAVLDLRLGEETSFPVARRLDANGIPYVFLSGYGSQADLPEGLSQRRVLRKPVQSQELLRALVAAMDLATEKGEPSE